MMALLPACTVTTGSVSGARSTLATNLFLVRIEMFLVYSF